MIFYHVSYTFIGNSAIFVPKVPKNRIKGEDWQTNRICVSNSIEGCILLRAGFYQGRSLLSGLSPGGNSTYFDYLYQCDVDFENVYVPTFEQVPDCMIHGESHREFWLLKPTEFKCTGKTSQCDWPIIKEI